MLRPGPYTAKYWQVERSLAAAFGIPRSGLSALRSRLGELQRQGVLGEKPGKGSRLTYQPDHFFRLVFALTLAQFGLAPAVIQRIIANHWDTQLKGIFQQATKWFGRADAPTTRDGDIVMVFGIKLVTDGTTRAVPTIDSYALSEVPQHVAANLLGAEPRLLLNVTERMRKFYVVLDKLHTVGAEPKPEAR